MATTRSVTLRVNGTEYERSVEVRKTLVDFLREDLGLVGTHVGCEHGVCGACTILFNGETARSCIMLAVQADGAELMTVEGLASPDGTLHPIQQSFRDEHGLQCGFCTPGFLMTTYELLRTIPDPSVEEIKDWLSGNLCRCTGYKDILESVQLAAARLRGEDPVPSSQREHEAHLAATAASAAPSSAAGSSSAGGADPGARPSPPVGERAG